MCYPTERIRERKTKESKKYYNTTFTEHTSKRNKKARLFSAYIDQNDTTEVIQLNPL